jgi:hypothetical protein
MVQNQFRKLIAINAIIGILYHLTEINAVKSGI